MAKLPEIKYPLFTTNLPSTNAQIKYRPFNVGEEKILLIANESDAEQVKISIKQVLSQCTMNASDVEKWTTFDIEWMFLQIRAKSIDNKASINIRPLGCMVSQTGLAGSQKAIPGPCKDYVTVDVNISDVKMKIVDKDGELQTWEPKNYKPETQIKFNDHLGVVLRYPTFNELDLKTDGKEKDEIAFDLLARCTVSLFDDKQVYPASENTLEELVGFYKQLDRKSIDMADDFFKNIPSVKHKVDYTCGKCGKQFSHVIEGLENFFD